MSEPAQPPPRGAIAGVLSQVMAYVNTPWKAVVVFLAVILGGVGWVIYQHEDELIEAWLTPIGVALNTQAVPATLDQLVANGGPDLVQVWSIDLSSNTQKFIAARKKDGERPPIPNPRRLPIVIATSDIKALVQVLEGAPVCINIEPSGAPISRRLAERGHKRGCAVPIPPSPDAFVGVIYMSWTNPPDASDENVAVAAAREVAGKLMTR